MKNLPKTGLSLLRALLLGRSRRPKVMSIAGRRSRRSRLLRAFGSR